MAGKIIFGFLRVALGALFVYAGGIKIWDFKQGASATPAFFEDIENYHVADSDSAKAIYAHVPWLTEARVSDLEKMFAVYLPWLELVAGGALLLRRATAGASVIVAVLMGVFIAALGSAWSRGLDISCGCFGHENATANFPLLLARDVALLLVALAIAWRERPRVIPESGSFTV